MSSDHMSGTVSLKNQPKWMAESEKLLQLADKEMADDHADLDEEDTEDAFANATYLTELQSCGQICYDFVGLENKAVNGEGDSSFSTFEEKARRMDDLSDGKGLLYKRILEPGKGPIITPNSLAEYHYRFFFEDQDSAFDSSYKRKRPERQRVHGGALVEGIDTALSTMRAGERAAFLIKASLMFGEAGCLPRIPRDADVFADIKLLRFIERNHIVEFFDKTQEERMELPLESHMNATIQTRKDGDVFFQSGKLHSALRKYWMGLNVLANAPVTTDEQIQQVREEATRLKLSLSQVFLKLDHLRDCVDVCDDVLQERPRDVCALYNKGMALTGLGEYNDAHKVLQLVLNIDPQHLDAQNALIDNANRRCDTVKKETLLYQKMFGGVKPATDKTKDQKKENNSTKPLTEFGKQMKAFLEHFTKQSTSSELNLPKASMTDEELAELESVTKEFKLTLITRKNFICFRK